VFKRLKDNLFGRPEDDATPEPQETPSPEARDPSAEPGLADGNAPAPGVAPTPPAAAPQSAPRQPRAAAPAASTAPTGPTQRAARPAEPVTPPDTATADAAEELADEEAAEDATERAGGGLGRFKNPFRLSLGRTRALFGRVNEALAADEITNDLWDELEETLISSDVGVATTERLLTILRERAQGEHFARGADLRDALKEELELLLGDPEPLVFSDTSPLTVILIVGVNGVGKTTSIAKLANLLKRQKHRVILAAGDTFRAAATEQIKLWGERVSVPVISHQYGADPAAVVYDAVQAGQARNNDVLIVDTAGRLHTKYNLMEELKKIVRVLQKYDSEAPHEVLLVIDATTGQNGYLQAKQFIADAGVSGVILTKLDGTARGGIVFAIASELGLPIKYVGTGERINDIAPFDSAAFVDALFEEE
jgi:fused signal recognition particle receptor